MEAVVFLEFDSGKPGLRDGLLDRIAPLALRGEARLNFVATDRPGGGQPASEIIVLGFKRADAAGALMLAWHDDPTFPPSVRMRRLSIEPIWSMEPLALMFP